MNEGNTTSLAPDIQRFATSAVQHLSDLTAAAYDLREACRFFTEGYSGTSTGVPASSVEAPRCDSPASLPEQGRERDARQCEMELDEGSAGRAENNNTAPRVVTAKPEHRIKGCGTSLPLPTSELAARVLGGKRTYIVDYYDAFRKACLAEECAQINQQGMRYLAYCSGYVRDRIDRDIDGKQRIVLVPRHPRK